MSGKTINALLLSLYRLCAFAGQPEATRGTDTHLLQRGGVMTIHKNEGMRQIEVRAGVVWITGKSSGDIVLRAGERWNFGNQWPYVIEALAESRIVLK